MTDKVHARIAVMGEIEVIEGEDGIYKYPMALLLTFDNAEDIRQAIKDGTCTFEFAP